MKKVLEKIVTVALALVSIVFVICLIIAVFNENFAVEANNSVVRALFLVFAVLFAVLSTINILTAFSDSDKINQVLLFRTRESTTKASIKAVKRLAKQATAELTEVKITNIVLIVDENNEVRMKAELKVKSEEIDTLVQRVRAILVTTYIDVLGLEFAGIDFKIKSIKNNYKPDSEKVEERMAQFKKELEDGTAKIEPLAEAQPEQTIEMTAEPVTEQEAESSEETVDSTEQTASAEEAEEQIEYEMEISMETELPEEESTEQKADQSEELSEE